MASVESEEDADSVKQEYLSLNYKKNCLVDNQQPDIKSEEVKRRRNILTSVELLRLRKMPLDAKKSE